MLHERNLAILQRLHEATVSKAITWSVADAQGWHCCKLGGQEICFRFLYFEATNQVGADPQMFDFMMPGCNARFACGTKGFDLLLEIMSAAFESDAADAFDPLQFLHDTLASERD